MFSFTLQIYIALPTVENKGIDIVLDFSDNLPGKVIGDPLRIRQIILNLLNNAAKVRLSPSTFLYLILIWF